jgi:hypothetical protein
MTDKNCMFQYATKHRIYADTDLITLESAKELFEKNKNDFLERAEDDEEPEMAIWIDCANSGSYGETLYHWFGDDFKRIDGVVYRRVY